MRFSQGSLSVEVQLAVRDVPLTEYAEEEVGAHDRSCYIGVVAGQYLQINMTFSGPWSLARCDVVIDGLLCRVVSVKGADPILKFVDQVWLLEDDQPQYAYMTVESAMPSHDSSPRTSLDKEELPKQLTRSLSQCISISVYSNAEGCHQVTLPCILEEESHPIAALLTSPDYVATAADTGRTHRVRLLSVGGPPKTMGIRHESGWRRGYAPFATFNFDYRDIELLKQLDLPVSAEKRLNMFSRRKRTFHDFQEDLNHGQNSRQSRDDVKSGTGVLFGGRAYYDRQTEWGHDGYGPGSHYHPCESRSRRSVESEDTSGSTSTGANTIPVFSRRTSRIAHSSPDSDEPLRRDSDSRLADIMSTAPTTSGAGSLTDFLVPHSISVPTLSRHGDPRQRKQSDSILETPKSPPKSPPVQASEIQPTIFRDMPLDMYEARISVVAMPSKFIKMNPTNRKIMPMAMLRIKEEEDRNERERLK